ncbi:hypothetical protein V2J09_011895 [Rumex salicifolius]
MLKGARVKVSDGRVVAGQKAQSVCDSLGFSNNYRVEAIGASGGVWLLWNAGSTDVRVVDDSADFIHARIRVARLSYSLIVGEIDRTIADIDEPCFTGGDFNVIVSLDERCGGSRGLMTDSYVFSELISRHELIDMGYSGSRFTWRWGPIDAPSVSKRLLPARLRWEEACFHHLPAIRSDHNPLLLSLTLQLSSNRNHRLFCFKAMWLTHPECLGVIDSKWVHLVSTVDLLDNLREELVIGISGPLAISIIEKIKFLEGFRVSRLLLRTMVLLGFLVCRINWRRFFSKRNFFGTRNHAVKGLSVVTELRLFFILVRSSTIARTHGLRIWVNLRRWWSRILRGCTPCRCLRHLFLWVCRKDFLLLVTQTC